jgi:hypothetical protein
MSCAGIFSGATQSCNDPLSVGLVQRLFLANLEDVASFTFDGTETNMVTGITMESGKTFFEFEGLKQSISCQSEYVPKPFSTAYKHTIDFSIMDVSASQRRNMEAMVFQPQVAITFGQNDSSLGNGAFEIHGINAGLEVVTNIRIPADNETGGAYRIQLATPDAGGIESQLPSVFFSTDYATTLAALVALKS